jgi:maleylpyruvate isomerase
VPDPAILQQRRFWLEAGDRQFFAALATVSDDALTGASALPGWTRAHLVTHMARNADALGNLLAWARTGVETPMYPNREARAADIEAGVGRPTTEIRADAVQSAKRLADGIAGLPREVWDREVRTAAGRAVPALEVPWMRVREVWVHAVDLDAGVTFEAVPADLAAALLDDALGSIGKRPGAPALTVRCTQSEREWRLGDGAAGAVAGTHAALLGWALGRSGAAAAADWPALPPWL